MIPLFKRYPALEKSLNYYSLGTFPTSVNKLEGLQKAFGRSDLFIKRDDLSGKIYGGNKIRKLEFVFGDAIANGSKQLVTSGAAGSNHALAVALYGAKAGLKVILMLFEQIYNPDICVNLMADFKSGAKMYLDKTYESHLSSMNRVIEENSELFHKPFVIAPGGSSVSGVCGYVNAAFELKEQINNGVIPEPSVIYVAMGTMGTAVGLLLGMKAAGIKSRIVAVQVVPSYVSNLNKFMDLLESTNRLLHDYDNTFPLCEINDNDLTITSDFLGPDYGFVTEKSKGAVELLEKIDNIKLDGVYTGKACAALIEDLKNDCYKGPILFWNTKNSIPLPKLSTGYTNLPEAFHQYFKTKD